MSSYYTSNATEKSIDPIGVLHADDKSSPMVSMHESTSQSQSESQIILPHTSQHYEIKHHLEPVKKSI